MTTPRTRGLVPALALVAVLGAGCAGKRASLVAGAPIDPGHGSVEEVTAALQRKGVPCERPTPVPLPAGTEQAIECVLAREEALVLLVHFLTPEGARAFEAETRAAGAHGAFAESWAVRTDDAEAAEVIAAAVQSRARS